MMTGSAFGRFRGTLSGTMMNDVSLLLARVALGSSIAAHGAQKALGWFEGPGPEGAAQFVESLGFRPGDRFAAAASWTEISSGAMIVLGLGGPLGPAMLLSTMIVAQTTVHAKNGYFAQNNGIELGTLYATGALALASSGYGRLSLDNAFGLDDKLRHPGFITTALAGGILTAVGILSQRNTGAEQPAPATAQSADRPNGAAASDITGEVNADPVLGYEAPTT